MIKVEYTAKFKKDLKLLKKRKKNLEKMADVMDVIESGGKLSLSLRDHELKGNWAGYRECHIEPDWLLIYELKKQMNLITYTRTGTHSDLFR